MHGGDRGRFAVTRQGTWSSGATCRWARVVNRRTGHALLWQIEHNGAWHWQVGEHTGTRWGASGSYLRARARQTSSTNGGSRSPRASRSSTRAGRLAVSSDGLEGAVAGLTAHRRAIRRPHEDTGELPVIFNDYMNTLNGDPSTERLLR